MKILDTVISFKNKPFIIAEMSGNHNQSLERALKIIDAAVEAGADAVKIQTYTADTMTLPGLLHIKNEESLWFGKELYDLYKEAYTPWEWHEKMFDYARKKGIIIFSSPFDETSVDFLMSLNAPAYKIASFENTDFPLLKKVAQTGKPVIMSTGVATISDIYQSVEVLKENGCKDIILLKCTSTYPSTPENTNLLSIPLLQQIFPDCNIGLSDHTMGIGAALGAIALGARVIEKHFTLNRADGGVDSAFSMEPEELKMLVKESKTVFLALGKSQLDIQTSEKSNQQFKRSIFVTKDIKKGESFTSENINVLRPGTGLHPKYYSLLIGKLANKNYEKGTPLSLDLLLQIEK